MKYEDNIKTKFPFYFSCASILSPKIISYHINVFRYNHFQKLFKQFLLQTNLRLKMDGKIATIKDQKENMLLCT